MIRTIIADDHALLRCGVRMILSREPDIQVCGEAANAAELLQLMIRHPCDVLVLDITMPGRSGLDLLRELKSEHCNLPILILSMHPEDQFAVRLLRSGAAGYMTKETAPEELARAIRQVASGRRYISPTLAELLADEVAGRPAHRRHELLSNREFEVLRLLASGRTVSEIGAQLCVSVKTVSTYRARILEKLEVETTAELIRYALEHGLTEPAARPG